MDILLVLAGVLLGIVGTFGGLALRSMYLDWKRARAWADAGKRWREIMDNMSYKRVSGHWTPKVLTPEERFADLQRRVSALFYGTPIDFDETLETLKTSENRLSEHEMKEHRDRLAGKAEGAFKPAEAPVS